MNKCQRLLFLSTVMCGFANTAMADQGTDRGLYLSGSIGQNWIQSGLPDETTSVFKVGAGWQFNSSFAAELNYNHLGKFPGPTPAYSDFNLTGISFSAIWQMPISSTTALFARVGQFWWSADSDYFFFSRSGGPNQTGTLDFSEADAFLGLGMSFEVSERLELDIEYNYYDFGFPDYLNSSNFPSFSNSDSALSMTLKLEI